MTNQKIRLAGGRRRKMRWLLPCGLLSLALTTVALATDPVFPPYPEVLTYNDPPGPMPTIDATNFVNTISFTINFGAVTLNPEVLETRNTVNYTNTGSMVANALANNGTGFQFDMQLNSGVRQMSGSFFNSGSIDCDSVMDNPGANTNGSVGQCIVWATNIVSPGSIVVGQGGLLRLTGQNVDLNHSTLTMEGLLQTSLTGMAGFTVLNESVGTDLLGTWQPSVSLTPTSAANEANAGPVYYMSLTNSTAYLEKPSYTGSTIGTNIVRAVFIQNLNPNINTSVYFDKTAIGPGAAHVAFFGPTYLDAVTGLLNTNYLILSDFYAQGASQPAVAADGLPVNFTITMTNTVYPPTILTALGAPTPSGWINLPEGNTFLPPYPATVTGNGYAYASVQFEPTTAATNNPSPKNVVDYLATNLTGRIQISAANLSLPIATISGENYLLLQATNQFNGSLGAQIFSPYTDISLAVTNGILTITNLLEPDIAAWNGTMTMWTSDWLYTDPATGYNWDFRALLIQLTGPNNNQPLMTATTPSAVWDMTLHVRTNLVISDQFNLLHSLTADASGLTLTANGPNAAAPDGELNLLFAPTPPNNLWSNSLPNLRSLTNNGSIRFSSLGLFGGPMSPYLTLINNGLISDVGAQIWANNFENGGTFTNGPGAFSLSAINATFTNGSLSAVGDISISAGTLLASNLVMLAPKSLTMAGTNQFSDGGPGNSNTWTVGNTSVGYGFSFPINPHNGDLLGTTITNYAPIDRQVINVSAGNDLGPTSAGFANNLAIGRLMLDTLGPTNDTWFYFTGTGVSNAIYVDHLELLGNCDYYSRNTLAASIGALEFNTNLVIYYADAVSDGADVSVKINGFNGNHLRWVPSYAGYYSSTNVVVNGVTVTFNAAAYPYMDSNGNGIDNSSDPTPFFLSSQVNLMTYPTNNPANTMVISWNTVPLATNSVYYSTNLATWLLLTNTYIKTNPFISPNPYPGPAANVKVFDPVQLPGRYYKVSVQPWLTYPY
jgi:hypothetical protein